MMNKLIFITLLILLNFSKAYATDYLKGSMKMSSSGMKAQQARIRIVSQNIANKNSISSSIDGKPYRRQTVVLKSIKNRELGGEIVKIKKYGYDKSPFKKIFDPSNPYADQEGYIELPNVDMHIENADSKDAANSYEANLNMLDLSKNLYNKTIDIIK